MTSTSGATPNPHHHNQPQSSNNTTRHQLDHNPHQQQHPITNSISKAIAQYTSDARLSADFEISGKSFDYSQSVTTTKPQTLPAQQIIAYLNTIQRGGHTQPFGCMVAIDEATFRVIAFSENAQEILGVTPQLVPSLDRTETLSIGTDIRTLFRHSDIVSLQKAFEAREISLCNPIWIHSRTSGKPFYAILHRIDVGILIDLEPTRTEDPALSIAGAVQSQKLAVRSISRLQSLPGGDIKTLCETVAEVVRDLTGYDRVMVYKFHEDEHGEVLAESRRVDLEPYTGLHYPAVDIPQASRFLFKQNRVRMIVNCHSKPVRVIQDEELPQPICLVGSTLRAPHKCHAQYMANMGSIASLALAIVIYGNDKEGRDTMRLWGLVVCHHTSTRQIPFPLRFACEFLMQAFGLQLNMELRLASQLLEKQVFKTQTLLCDMLLRDSPTGIVTQNPNIINIVKCDGAALYYKGKYFQLGVAPTEPQVMRIIEWLLAFHGDSTGLTTDSLADAGFPEAASLGDAVCGMAVAYITKNDYLFWFRSHTAKEIKWGGAKHHPEDKDDGQKMHPRSSFKAFLEVVKSHSLPWENSEMDAIHSLQLILRDWFWNTDGNNSKADVKAQLGELESQQGVDELSSAAREMVRLIETATAPIFAVDDDGCVTGWNAKVAELTGISDEEAIGKSLVSDLVYKEYEEKVQKILSNALKGEEDKNVEVKLRTFGAEQHKKADVTDQKIIMDKFIHIQGDYKAIVHSPNPLIPPIFASDENTCCLEWNTAMEKLTGWARGDIIGKMLVGEVFGNCGQLEGSDAFTKLMIVLHNAIIGQDTEKLPFTFFDRNGKYVQALLTANKRVNMEGHIIGAFCFLQIASPELQEALKVQTQQETKCLARMKELAYIFQEIKNPLRGISFTNSLFGTTDLTDDQKQLLETSASCEKQITKIVKDVDLESVVMILLREKCLQLIQDIPEEIKELAVYGDQARIQQVLANFLLNMVQYTSSTEGWVKIHVHAIAKQNSEGLTIVRFEFRILFYERIACPGDGLPPKLIQDMFNSCQWTTKEGLGLSMCRKILELMSGEVRYMRESEKCYFLVVLELPTSREDSMSID
ncbi:hypothetical protein ACFE04_007170 [Oxalis oulophora]